SSANSVHASITLTHVLIDNQPRTTKPERRLTLEPDIIVVFELRLHHQSLTPVSRYVRWHPSHGVPRSRKPAETSHVRERAPLPIRKAARHAHVLLWRWRLSRQPTGHARWTP